ncbi:MAG: hypothetical protein IPM14_11125 [bacterium]|nr:hypothetical protein [bacterium]
MKLNLKIFHWIIFLWLLLVIFRFELILDYYSLLFGYSTLLFSDFSSALTILTYRFTDAMLSSVVLILLFVLTLIYKNKLSFLQQRINLSFAFLILLCFVFIFAPIIADENPEYSGKLSVAKLLPPISSLKQLELRSSESLIGAEKFVSESEKIIKPSYNDKIILADSVNQTNKVTYFQKNIFNEIEIEKLAMINDKIDVKEKILSARH